MTDKLLCKIDKGCRDSGQPCRKNLHCGVTRGNWSLAIIGGLPFISKNWQVPILRDGEGKWVADIDDKDQKVLRGLTLTDFDVESSGSR